MAPAPAPAKPFSQRLTHQVRSAWQQIPVPARQAFWQYAGNPVRNTYYRQSLARPAHTGPDLSAGPLVIAGLFSTANGIGEAARGTYRALKAAGLNPIAVDLSERLAPCDLESGIPCEPMPQTQAGTLILQLNGPETQAGLQHLGMKRGRHWHTIGYWAWELPTFPTGWERAFIFLSEIWTISAYTANALARHPKAPDIHILGHGVHPPANIRRDRAQFGWPADAFIFLTQADTMSSLERKNPFAAIAAHKSAFGGDPTRRLVIKTRNLARSKRAEADLRAAIGGAQNIEVMDISLSEDQRWELLMATDAFVSLHRAEGFGLVLAEAMALGKPVLATSWSGNMDFTSKESAYLVDHSLVALKDRYGVYTDTDAEWADPDIVHASEQLTAIVENAEERSKKVKAARKIIDAHASQASLAKALLARLNPAARP